MGAGAGVSGVGVGAGSSKAPRVVRATPPPPCAPHEDACGVWAPQVQLQLVEMANAKKSRIVADGILRVRRARVQPHFRPRLHPHHLQPHPHPRPRLRLYTPPPTTTTT